MERKRAFEKWGEWWKRNLDNSKKNEIMNKACSFGFFPNVWSVIISERQTYAEKCKLKITIDLKLLQCLDFLVLGIVFSETISLQIL